ncbi:hypothetical protein R6Q57_027377 [Mikania cordata]
MGGRKQKKKINLDWATKEVSVTSNYSVTARNLRKSDLGAVIFGTTHQTIDECLSRQLFGLPEGHYSYIKNIKQGLVLFLFNYSDRKLHGIFQAAGPCQMNIDQYAWVADGDDTGYTKFPAQVKICVKSLCHPLSEEQFQPVIAPNYYESKHFHFELDHGQTKQLVSLFTSSPLNSGISSKWSNLYASLPAMPKRQEYKAPVSAQLANPSHALSENLNQTSKVSYASALGKTTSSVSSSQLVGKWSALFTSDSSCETSQPVGNSRTSFAYDQTPEAWDELPMNQEYENKSDFPEADTWEGTWEESQWVATSADEAVCDQTWLSDLNPQANTVTVKPDIMQGNTCEESQHIATGTCEVEHGQTSSLIGQNHTEPPSSLQKPLDENPVFSPSYVKNIESAVEKNHDEGGISASNTSVEISTNLQQLVAKLMQDIEVMKGTQLKQIVKNNRLEQELDASKLEIEQLANRVSFLESELQAIVDPAEVDNHLPNKFMAKLTDSVFIVGGHDGSSWLRALDSYFPARDVKISRSPMNSVKRYASAATLNGELYHFGGDGLHTVESFNPTNNQWNIRPPLYWKNINVAGASIEDKIFVVGGANGPHCSSEVEYLDLIVGRWLPARSMQSKRLAPAAAKLNNVLYVTGGYDGASYLSSVERFDPREKLWYKIPNMNTRKGCHSMVVLNEKLYTVGGFNEDGFLATLEYLDIRMGAWIKAEPMIVARSNCGAFVLEGKMYTIGGRKENDEVLDIVECYKEGSGWKVDADLKAIGKRSHFSAIVI